MEWSWIGYLGIWGSYWCKMERLGEKPRRYSGSIPLYIYQYFQVATAWPTLTIARWTPAITTEPAGTECPWYCVQFFECPVSRDEKTRVWQFFDDTKNGLITWRCVQSVAKYSNSLKGLNLSKHPDPATTKITCIGSDKINLIRIRPKRSVPTTTKTPWSNYNHNTLIQIRQNSLIRNRWEHSDPVTTKTPRSG